MKKVECKFVAGNGSLFIRRVNTSGSAKKAAEALKNDLKVFELHSYKVVKEW